MKGVSKTPFTHTNKKNNAQNKLHAGNHPRDGIEMSISLTKNKGFRYDLTDILNKQRFFDTSLPFFQQFQLK